MSNAVPAVRREGVTRLRWWSAWALLQHEPRRVTTASSLTKDFVAVGLMERRRVGIAAEEEGMDASLPDPRELRSPTHAAHGRGDAAVLPAMLSTAAAAVWQPAGEALRSCQATAATKG